MAESTPAAAAEAGSCLPPFLLMPVLDGVVVTLSGYQNPTLGELRDAAEALGAKCKLSFSSDVTHVCSAFENTPKTNAARAAGRAWVVKGEWLRECQRARCRLPEAGFCLGTQPAAPHPHPPPAQVPLPSSAMARSRTSPAPSPGPADAGGNAAGRLAGDEGCPVRKRARVVPSPPPHPNSASSVQSDNKEPDAEAGSSSSPVLISKVTHVDDPVASLDLTEGAHGASTPKQAMSEEDHVKAFEAQGAISEAEVAACVGDDLDRFQAWLRKECDIADLELEDCASKGILEACKLALEKCDGAGCALAELTDEWTGPLPAALQKILELGARGAGATGFKRQVQGCLSAYEAALSARRLRASVCEWLPDDVRAFETYLKETVEPAGREGEIDILDIARRGIVEAFDSALRSWDDDGDFLAFQEAWDGPLPKGLRAIVDAMQGSDAGMVFHLKVIERLKVYREAYSAALAPVLREEPGQGAMTRS